MTSYCVLLFELLHHLSPLHDLSAQAAAVKRLPSVGQAMLDAWENMRFLERTELLEAGLPLLEKKGRSGFT